MHIDADHIVWTSKVPASVPKSTCICFEITLTKASFVHTSNQESKKKTEFIYLWTVAGDTHTMLYTPSEAQRIEGALM